MVRCSMPKEYQPHNPNTQKFKSMIQRAASQSAKCYFGEQEVRICFANEETASDIALALSEKYGCIGLAFVLQENGSSKGSLRSKNKINLVPLAQALGGGGHPFAAAFNASPELLAAALSGRDLLSFTQQA